MYRALFFQDPAFHLFAQFYFFMLGTIVGSFLNVCIYRIPRKQSIATPRSRCPQCETPIRWYQNIPLLSWIFLAGRCANCSAPISIMYPLVELITGIFFWLLYRYFGISFATLIYAIFGCSTIILILVDYYHRLLPAVITFPGIALGLITSFINPFVGWRDSVLGLIIGGLIPALAMWIFRVVRKKEGLGHGDVVMLAMVGAFLGWQQVLLVLFFSSLIGSILGAIVILALKKGRDFMLPFGSFIGAAALFAVFWGRDLWLFYVSR